MPRPRNVLGTLGIVFACACQTVFGDFEISPAPAEEPARVLGTSCEPGEYRCTNERLETCSDDRQGFVLAQVCASAAECNLNARTCRACVPGEHMCRGNLLERCDDTSSWVLQATCDTPALCSVASDGTSGTCTPALCEAGQHACEGAMLVRCSAGRDAWEDVTLCENPELCDPTYADEFARTHMRGACRPAACEPDEFRCEGALLQHCWIDRTGFRDHMTCESAELCSASLGACVACEPGAVECNGAELRRCTATGGWETLAQCDAPSLCNAETARCDAAECTTPGSLRCGGGALLEVCTSELTWDVVAACATRALCSAEFGRCLTPACEKDETRCLDNRHERCSDDQSRWELVATCPADARCEPHAGCVTGSCADGSTRCNGRGLERCTGGVFEEIARCETEALCNVPSGTCEPPKCSEPYVCENSIIRKCRPGRDGLDEVLTCTGTTCDVRPDLVTGQPECDACTANEYVCSGNELRRCSSDGRRLERVATCTMPCNAATVPPTCI